MTTFPPLPGTEQLEVAVMHKLCRRSAGLSSVSQGPDAGRRLVDTDFLPLPSELMFLLLALLAVAHSLVTTDHSSPA